MLHITMRKVNLQENAKSFIFQQYRYIHQLVQHVASCKDKSLPIKWRSFCTISVRKYWFILQAKLSPSRVAFGIFSQIRSFAERFPLRLLQDTEWNTIIKQSLIHLKPRRQWKREKKDFSKIVGETDHLLLPNKAIIQIQILHVRQTPFSQLGMLIKIRNSPPNTYHIFVKEPALHVTKIRDHFKFYGSCNTKGTTTSTNTYQDHFFQEKSSQFSTKKFHITSTEHATQTQHFTTIQQTVYSQLSFTASGFIQPFWGSPGIPS